MTVVMTVDFVHSNLAIAMFELHICMSNKAFTKLKIWAITRRPLWEGALLCKFMAWRSMPCDCKKKILTFQHVILHWCSSQIVDVYSTQEDSIKVGGQTSISHIWSQFCKEAGSRSNQNNNNNILYYIYFGLGGGGSSGAYDKMEGRNMETFVSMVRHGGGARFDSLLEEKGEWIVWEGPKRDTRMVDALMEPTHLGRCQPLQASSWRGSSIHCRSNLNGLGRIVFFLN